MTTILIDYTYQGVSKSFRTGRLERELQMVQLSDTRCSCIAILWVILVSFAVITLCVASQWVFIVVVVVVVVYFAIDSVWKLLDTPSYSTLFSVLWLHKKFQSFCISSSPMHSFLHLSICPPTNIPPHVATHPTHFTLIWPFTIPLFSHTTQFRGSHLCNYI
jgi:hypothetical protein